MVPNQISSRSRFAAGMPVNKAAVPRYYQLCTVDSQKYIQVEYVLE